MSNALGDFFDVVGHIDESEPVAASEMIYDCANAAFACHVKSVQRLVKDEQFGLFDERACK